MDLRRTLLTLVSGALLLFASTAGAQPRVGLLWLQSELTEQNVAALSESLREHGFVVGRDVRFEPRNQLASYSQLGAAAEELVRLRVDVILAWGDTATRAARKATSTIPIVMIQAADPVAAGLVASLARPGGNVTGLTAFGQDLMGKRLEILKQAAPHIRKVAVLMNPESAGQPESFKRAEAAAQALGLQAMLVEVRNAGDIEAAFPKALRASADAITVVPSTMLRSHRVRLAALASQNRMPAMFSDASYVEVGGLMGYGVDPRTLMRVAGNYIGRILKGANPSEIPVERLHQLHLTINLQTAKKIGVTLPQSLVARADRVIE